MQREIKLIKECKFQYLSLSLNKYVYIMDIIVKRRLFLPFFLYLPPNKYHLSIVCKKPQGFSGSIAFLLLFSLRFSLFLACKVSLFFLFVCKRSSISFFSFPALWLRGKDVKPKALFPLNSFISHIGLWEGNFSFHQYKSSFKDFSFS